MKMFEKEICYEKKNSVIEYNICCRSTDYRCYSIQQYVPDRPEAWNENLSGDNASGGIKIPGFGRLYFPSDTDKVQMTLANPSDNECYFIYSIHLDEPDGELLYTSDKVYPGMAIYELTLFRALAVGEYELYIHIAPYDAKSDKQLNAALIKAPLTVTNS